MVKERKGIYRILSQEQKQEIYRLLKIDSSIEALQEISKIYNTQIKNLKRWCVQGIQRKPGCGRKKMNLFAELQLEQWALKRSLKLRRRVKRCEIQKQALILFKNPEFKASKAWQDEFVKSHNLKYKIYQVLFDSGFLSSAQRKKFISSTTQEQERTIQLKDLIEISIQDAESIQTRAYHKNKISEEFSCQTSICTRKMKPFRKSLKDISDDEEQYQSSGDQPEQRYEDENSYLTTIPKQTQMLACEDSNQVYQYLNLGQNSEQRNYGSLNQ